MQIARCYGADASATRRANPNLNPAKIRIGTVITVPNIGSNGRIYGPPCIRSHTVQSGDTWTSIAQAYNADVAVLQAANRNVTLTAGRVIRVPLNSAGGSPQPLPTPGTPVPTTPAPTACNRMQFVADVTVPDGQTVTGGSTFTKTWRLRNTGTCTWSTGYLVTWASGERMAAPDTVQLTATDVAPNGTVDVSVNLQAPATAGTYQANFRLRAPDGTVFGNFWVRVVVPQ
jgi:LysM repeat protein